MNYINTDDEIGKKTDIHTKNYKSIHRQKENERLHSKVRKIQTDAYSFLNQANHSNDTVL
jgi:hypothetical protein